MQNSSSPVITHNSSTINTELLQQNLPSNVNDSGLKPKENENIPHDICEKETSKKETDSIDSYFVKRWADEEDDDIYDIDVTIQPKNNVTESCASTKNFQTKRTSVVNSPLSNNRYRNSPLSNNRYRNSPQQRSPNNYWKSSNSINFQYKDNFHKGKLFSFQNLFSHISICILYITILLTYILIEYLLRRSKFNRCYLES
jgi:hypothetical protein